MPGTSARRSDPHRRSRIIDAALDVIAEHGVGGASHRRIAAVADVPLGSMTYHFEGMDELLHAAFGRFADSMAEKFDAVMAGAVDEREAKRRIVDHVSSIFESPRTLILTSELYTLASRDPSFRDITSAWMARSRVTLERSFDPMTARLVDAMVEGMAIHIALEEVPLDRAADAQAAFDRLILTEGRVA